LTVEGTVQVFPVNGTGWVAAQTNQPLRTGDRLRTGVRSRATARLSDLSVLRINELTTLQIQPPPQPGKAPALDVRSGAGYFLGRGKPTEQEFRTPLTSGAIRGTEFNLTVAEDGRTVVSLIDGEITLSNPQGEVAITSGEQGIVEPGQAPRKSPMLEAINIIQWCLYYPGVLDADELELSAEERQPLADSLAAYRAGDLLEALARYPANRPDTSDSERVYHAALLLSVGQVQQAEELLARLSGTAATSARPVRLGHALRELVAVVKHQSVPRAAQPSLATEWLVESYYFQAQAQLKQALEAAQAAARQASDFGFAWARVAELELCFGRLSKAKAALDRSLELSPRNAQSLAVKGFILLARNRPHEAEAAFDQAVAVDGALGNAWLGRGLCQIRRGHADAGRQDVQVAAVLEPQRAILRSYLGKAFSNERDNLHAQKELALAKRLDPNDPTAWLYAALVEQQENEVNEAVRDLEESKRLNDNRRLFRSQLLLDEDQAVRSANLASIYQDTGFFIWNKDVAVSDWSVREASRAVNYDYANFSAHQFLANSYDALRDPNQINLRYETPWFSELLVAHLLAPVGAGNLSEFVAEQPYSRLSERNHFGVSSDTEYLSHGDWLERASQYGTWGPATYAVDAEYRSYRGWRGNNDLEQFTGSLKAKDQLTPQDSLYIEGLYYNSRFGDVAQYYNQYGTITNLPAPSQTFRGYERQEPDVFLGYHHEWAPGIHTLFLGAHLNDTLTYDDSRALIPFTRVRGGQVTSVVYLPFDVDYDRQFDAWSGELQQIVQNDWQTLVVGGRYQSGSTESSSDVNNPNNFPPLISSQDLTTDLNRYTVYAYETLKLFDQVELTGGVSYDHLHYPRNIDTPPFSDEETDADQVSPKAGIIWSPLEDTHFRFAYTRSLGGMFYDTSVRLEPTQVAGFNQAFRSLLPEAVAGLVPGTHFTTYGVGVDQSFKSQTYLSVAAEWLESDADRTRGVITNRSFIPVPNRPGSTAESLDFTDKSLVVSLTQLLGREWSVGSRYQLSRADLTDQFTDISPAAAQSVNRDETALLHQLILYAGLNHRSGFFAQVQALWYNQHDTGYPPSMTDTDFWQFNAYAGYRFLNRAAEVKLGFLNLTDQDYLLNPLNLYYDLPRSRTLSVSLKFYF
jgi:Tfp pilus assembly protein PilF